jgi:tetratricopeptide (TPR) repeat protein
MESIMTGLHHKSIFLLISGFILFSNNSGAVALKQFSSDTSLIASYIKNAKRQSSGSTDSAVYYFQKAIKLANKGAFSPSAPKKFRNKFIRQLIQAELGLGLEYYQVVDYPKAMQHYELAYKSAKALGQHFYLGECLFNFAEVHLEQSQYSLAMTRYFGAMQAYNQAKNKTGVYWCYIGMGIAQKQCGNFNDAIICYENALAIAVEGEMKTEVAYCYNNLGNVYRQQGNFVKSMDAYEKALSQFTILKDDLSVSDCLNNIGNLYLDKGDPFRSLEYYNRSVNFAKVKSDNYRMIGRYKNLAEAYSVLNDFSNASLFLDKAVKLAEKSGDKALLASCYVLIGKLHFTNGNHEIGISYQQKSAEIFHAVGAKAEEAEVLIALANSELIDNKVNVALTHAGQGEEIAKSVGAVKTIVTASECLAKIWERKGDPLKALHYAKMVVNFQDSLLNIEKNRAIEEIEAGFTRTRLLNENLLLARNGKLQQQTLKTRNFALFALALCLLLSFLVIWLVYKRHIDAKTMAMREKAVKEKEIEKLSDDLSVKERELTTKTLLINQKNGLLQKLIGELETLKADEGSPANRIGRLQHELKQELSPNAWKEFEVQFNDVHPGFQNRLLEKFPELSPAERRLCTFLRLDMNTREIASLTGQSFKSLEVARTRIRKKMDLPHEGNLTNFIALI